MKWSLGKYMLLLFLLLQAGPSWGKDIPARPNPPRLVNDFAGLLSADEQQALERKLVAFDDSTSTQIAIVTERSLDGDEIERYAHELAETWGIGRDKKNNGVLIYVAVDDREMSIEVGYGLEPVITDVAAFRVRTEILTPYFRSGQFYTGLDSASTVLMKLATEEFTAKQWNKEKPKSTKKSPGVGKIFLVIVIVIILMILFGRGGGNNRGNRRRIRGPFVPPIWFGGRGGGFGGGGFGGGSGGGGFGGFGGGSFGGGGSSGSW